MKVFVSRGNANLLVPLHQKKYEVGNFFMQATNCSKHHQGLCPNKKQKSFWLYMECHGYTQVK